MRILLIMICLFISACGQKLDNKIKDMSPIGNELCKKNDGVSDYVYRTQVSNAIVVAGISSITIVGVYCNDGAYFTIKQE